MSFIQLLSTGFLRIKQITHVRPKCLAATARPLEAPDLASKGLRYRPFGKAIVSHLRDGPSHYLSDSHRSRDVCFLFPRWVCPPSFLCQPFSLSLLLDANLLNLCFSLFVKASLTALVSSTILPPRSTLISRWSARDNSHPPDPRPGESR
jgi:hypothetical protein